MQSQLLIGLVEASTSVTPFGVVLLIVVAIASAAVGVGGRVPLSDLAHSSFLTFVCTIFCFRGSTANPYNCPIDERIIIPLSFN